MHGETVKNKQVINFGNFNWRNLILNKNITITLKVKETKWKHFSIKFPPLSRNNIVLFEGYQVSPICPSRNNTEIKTWK